MSKLRSIQTLRALAATAVVVHHAVREIDPDSPAKLGAAGVDLFFVISGFIMATIASRRSPSEFLADRAWRIFPLWLVAVIPWLLTTDPDLATTISSLTLWPIYANSFHLPALGIGWSLCFELLFYAAFALALARLAAVPLGLFALCFCLAPLTQSALVHYFGSPLILEFLAGVAIARIPAREGLALPLIVLGIAWFAFSPVAHYDRIFGPGTFTRVFAWGIPAAFIVYGARSLERRFERPLFDLPVLLGNASYSIYLFHPMVVNAGIVGGIALSLVLGLLMHFALERPMIRLRSLWRRQSPSASTAFP